MRSFPQIYLLLFIVFYILTCLGAYLNLKILFTTKFFKILFWAYSIFLILIFVFLFIYPNQPQNSKSYIPYFYFNTFLFIDLIIKLVLSLFFFLGILIKQKRIISNTGVILSIGLGLGMFYGLLFGNKEIKITRQELTFNTLPNNFNEYKIVQISDIHLGSFQKSNRLLLKAVQIISDVDPDLILFTGDLVNNFSYETEGWASLFQNLNSYGKSFSILGNHDYGDYTTWLNENEKLDNFEKIVTANSDFGFRILRNENKIIRKGKDSIFIVGVENWGHPPFPQYANLEEATNEIPDGAFKILMTHDPAHWEKLINENRDFQLTLSGHTHGLQWGIKLAGIPFSLAYLTRKNWGGLYNKGDEFLNVNTGLGTVGIPWRIDMPAEITILTLKRSKINREQ